MDIQATSKNSERKSLKEPVKIKLDIGLKALVEEQLSGDDFSDFINGILRGYVTGETKQVVVYSNSEDVKAIAMALRLIDLKLNKIIKATGEVK